MENNYPNNNINPGDIISISVPGKITDLFDNTEVNKQVALQIGIPSYYLLDPQSSLSEPLPKLNLFSRYKNIIDKINERNYFISSMLNLKIELEHNNPDGIYWNISKGKTRIK